MIRRADIRALIQRNRHRRAEPGHIWGGKSRSDGLVFPELKGKLDGTAVRVPTPNVSLVSLDVVLERQTTREESTRR